MAKNKKTESMTVDEFKQFIKGLAYFDPEWSPSKEQWKHIKELIENLKPEIIKQTIEVKSKPKDANVVAVANRTIENNEGGDYGVNQPRLSQENFPRQPTTIQANTPKSERIGGELVLPPARQTGSEFL